MLRNRFSYCTFDSADRGLVVFGTLGGDHAITCTLTHVSRWTAARRPSSPSRRRGLWLFMWGHARKLHQKKTTIWARPGGTVQHQGHCRSNLPSGSASHAHRKRCILNQRPSAQQRRCFFCTSLRHTKTPKKHRCCPNLLCTACGRFFGSYACGSCPVQAKPAVKQVTHSF